MPIAAGDWKKEREAARLLHAVESEGVDREEAREMLTWRVCFVAVMLCGWMVIGSTIATQVTAWQFGWHHVLGEPMFSAGIVAIYAPFKIVSWTIWWPNTWPVWTGVAVGLAVAAAPIVLAAANAAAARANKKDDGWGTLDHARKSRILSPEQEGAVIGQTDDGRLLTHPGDEHMLLVGSAGSGKSSGPVISTLLNVRKQSVLVYDPKRELYAATARWRSQFGDAFYFDPTDPDSARYNPLNEIRIGTHHEVGDVQTIANILVESSGLRDDSNPFWPITASSLIAAAILHILRKDHAERDLGHLLRRLYDIDSTLTEMAASEHPVVKAAGKQLLPCDAKLKESIVKTTTSALEVFLDPMVCDKTSKSDFRISDLFCSKYPISLYLQMRPSDSDRLEPLTKMIITQIFRATMYDRLLMPDGREKLRRALFVHDEFASLKIKIFAWAMQQIRQYGMTFMLVSQSINAILEKYGRYQGILANCRIIVAFATNDISEQKALSDASGMIKEEKRGETIPRAGFTWGKGTRNISTEKKPIINPGEVRMLDDDRELVLVAGAPPFKVGKVRWYKHKALCRRGVDGGMDYPQNAAILEAVQADRKAAEKKRAEDAPTIAATPQPAQEPAACMHDGDKPEAELGDVPDLLDLIRASGMSSDDAMALFPGIRSKSIVASWLSGTRKIPEKRAAMALEIFLSSGVKQRDLFSVATDRGATTRP